MDITPPLIAYPWDRPPEPGEAVAVAEGIMWLRLPLPMVLNHVNVYALDDGDGWTIVDTGLDAPRVREAWAAALAGPLSGRPVRRVLLTHHHPDHVGLVGWFQSQGAELVTSQTAWLFARMLTLDVQELPTEETLAFWRAAGMAPGLFAERENQRPMNFADMVAPMPLGFTRVVEGGTFSAGGREWMVRMGAGHAPEHVTLWSTDGELVIGGDQLLPSISPNLGVYATEPEADPVAEWIAACERLAVGATDTQLVLPGHNRPFRGLPFRLMQLAENHHGALDRLRRHLVDPRTACECFEVLFSRRIGSAEYGLALVEAMAHCLHLWHWGEAGRTLRDDGAWLWQVRS